MCIILVWYMPSYTNCNICFDIYFLGKKLRTCQCTSIASSYGGLFNYPIGNPRVRLRCENYALFHGNDAAEILLKRN